MTTRALWDKMGRMPAQSHSMPPVPVADLALDATGRGWHLIVASLDPFASLWYCPATGAGATWAHLNIAYGVTATVNTRAEVPA